MVNVKCSTVALLTIIGAFTGNYTNKTTFLGFCCSMYKSAYNVNQSFGGLLVLLFLQKVYNMMARGGYVATLQLNNCFNFPDVMGIALGVGCTDGCISFTCVKVFGPSGHELLIATVAGTPAQDLSSPAVINPLASVAAFTACECHPSLESSGG